ncbi:Dam family site-specific DNA-(adenine-N6)-methyltransferase [Lentzea sp. BCCO 10_0798]|uniref:site-specific DNA-methyltransferase (adenine-specific) n=1 Tax=Lentzea kristufekii TaxID=3095430 RepID=A0ABU4U2L4_9PSEU|nr:Dam family site-specific DNA-(adenine-N6)-methyltransferase [Lentzea sp. BCCO 10_0798]MDX8054814.1 Dam family site-specific DNA-(adenine-N6)-methyltransferase [Lentzea sp. BCCO 10_0798]
MRLQTMSSTRSEGRSFLKWAGGKTRYADQLVAAAPPFTGTYREPFMGSAAVFFELAPPKAVLSDANPELVHCFRGVASDPKAVMGKLDEMPNTREYFEEVRRQDVDQLDAIERAARVIYLNKTSFRGLWRVNQKGKFNVPYGAYDRPYYNPSTLLTASKLLQGVEIRESDFGGPLEDASEGDWVFLDPPYIPEGGYSDFKRYTAGQFHDDDHERLAEAMRQADKRGVFLTLTNSDTDATRAIFKDFEVRRMATRRDINLQSAKRSSWDLVFTNYELSGREEELRLF